MHVRSARSMSSVYKVIIGCCGNNCDVTRKGQRLISINEMEVIGKGGLQGQCDEGEQEGRVNI